MWMWYTVLCWHNIFTYTKSKATEQVRSCVNECVRAFNEYNTHIPYECEHLTVIFLLSFSDTFFFFVAFDASRRSGVEAFELNFLLYDMYAPAFANDILCSLNFSKLILDFFFV